jgi:hypothetical protein
MKQLFACTAVVLTIAVARPLAADTATIAGAWILTASAEHQVQLGLELKQDGRNVTGTLLVMGRSVSLDGEFADNTLSLSGDGGNVGGHLEGTVKMTATLKNDGTLEGVLRTEKISLPWKGERFTERKP